MRYPRAMSIANEGPNAEQIRYWNEQAGSKWVALQAMIDAQIRPLGEAAMERAAIAAGERVLDVGCGCGDTTLELARRVGPKGSVIGIDISAVMLERARQAAHDAGLAQAHFAHADAQTHAFSPGHFDVVFSRFGIMFFAHPEEAFANLRQGLRRGGRLAFVCWQRMNENPWMLVPMMAALRHLPAFQPPPKDAPGPFAFAEPDRVRRILEGAGFTDVELEDVRRELGVGGGANLDRTVDFLLQMGPTSRLLRDADAALRSVVGNAIREALQPYAGADGVRMAAAAWVVTARR
jgi:SAM-dependent methyltransferase